jgi:hypothetical protein
VLAPSSAAPAHDAAPALPTLVGDVAAPSSAAPPAAGSSKPASCAALDGTASCPQPGTATQGTSSADGLGEWQPDWSECDQTIDIIAHGAQNLGDASAFAPPQGTDHYEMFWYAPTWSEKMHVIRIDPIVDNGAVLHHWLLYMHEQSDKADGSHNSDLGLQSPDAQLLSGWAPGNKSIKFGREIGMQVIQGPKARFGMEIHYNTTANPSNRNDRSGARLCLTKKLRPKEAATHWLGTQLIANLLPLGGMLNTPSTCGVQKESHIIAYSPHMHKQGRYMKSIITKKDGSKVTLTDRPFVFDDQQIYPVDSASHEIVVGPGDSILTTCTFDASTAFTFGPNTADEMCYNFVVAWPVGSLSNGSAGVVGGKNTCIDLL